MSKSRRGKALRSAKQTNVKTRSAGWLHKIIWYEMKPCLTEPRPWKQLNKPDIYCLKFTGKNAAEQFHCASSCWGWDSFFQNITLWREHLITVIKCKNVTYDAWLLQGPIGFVDESCPLFSYPPIWWQVLLRGEKFIHTKLPGKCREAKFPKRKGNT